MAPVTISTSLFPAFKIRTIIVFQALFINASFAGSSLPDILSLDIDTAFPSLNLT